MATVNKDFRVKHGLVVEGTTGTIGGNNIITTGSTTDNLQEGLAHLYYTDARVKNVIDAAITSGQHTNISVTYDESNNILSLSAENGVADSTTDDLVEGIGNLYFTDERAQDAVAAAIANGNHTNITVSYDDATNSISFTGAVTYTDADAREAISGGDSIAYDPNTGIISAEATTLGGISVTTGGLEVNRNVVDTWYDANGSAAAAQTAAAAYTDSRINDTAISNTKTWSSQKIESEISTAVSGLVDGAPAMLDTLNELAAAIADNPNYATDVANLIAGKQNTLVAGNGININPTTSEITVDDTVIASVNYVDTNFVNITDLPGQLDDYIPLTDKGANGGVATLSSTGDVPVAQLGNVKDALTITNAGGAVYDATAYILNGGAYFAQLGSGGNTVGQKQWFSPVLESSAQFSGGFLAYGASSKLTITGVDSAGNVHTEEVLVSVDASNNVSMTEYAVITTGNSLFDIDVQSVSSPWGNANKITTLRLKRANGATSGNQIKFSIGSEGFWIW